MKISISLADVDVDFLDGYARTQGLGTRSAAVREAVQLLRTAELGDDYANAWAEWERDPASEAWESTASDGLPPSE